VERPNSEQAPWNALAAVHPDSVLGYTVGMRRRELLALPIVAAALPQAEAAPPLPRPLPNYKYSLPDGTKLDLAKFRGKVCAIEVLNTTCPHCQKASMILQSVYAKYGSKGFQPVGIAVNDPTGMVINPYIKQYGLTYPVAFTTLETAHNLLQKSFTELMYVPNLLFVDKAGMIQSYYPAGDKFYDDEENNVIREVEKMLGLPITRPLGGASKPDGASKSGAAPKKAPAKKGAS